MIWKFLPFNLIDAVVGLTKLLTGATAVWPRSMRPDNLKNAFSPPPRQRIYFANHTSNLDTIIIWAALPYNYRKLTRPVAAKDYWNKPGIRQHIATKELNVVFIERRAQDRTEDVLEPLRRALRQGESLIVFPEGQRNKEVVPGEFKSGIYTLHKEFPDVQLVPLYLENVAKTFPRGAPFPLPLLCRAHFGEPFDSIHNDNPYLEESRRRALFLSEARLKVIELIPDYMKRSITDFEEQVKNPPIRETV